jgi:hypothetical protein
LLALQRPFSRLIQCLRGSLQLTPPPLQFFAKTPSVVMQPLYLALCVLVPLTRAFERLGQLLCLPYSSRVCLP